MGLFFKPESSAADVRALVQAVSDLQARCDRLEGSVAEARMRYLEALDKVVAKLTGRLARQLRNVSREDAPGDAIEEHPLLQYPPQSARRSNLRGW